MLTLYVSPKKGQPAFDRKNGIYPIDEQDSLFRIYVKAHKDQLAPTLFRLCKQKGIF
jgi:hypothetical protein